MLGLASYLHEIPVVHYDNLIVGGALYIDFPPLCTV